MQRSPTNTTALLLLGVSLGCTPRQSLLGYNETTSSAVTSPAGGGMLQPEPDINDAAASNSGAPRQGTPEPTPAAEAGTAIAEPTSGVAEETEAGIASGGGSETDGGVEVEPSAVVVPRQPNVNLTDHFVTELGVSDQAVLNRLEADFQQLFHGDPNTEAIYVEVDATRAYIHDVLHDDTRSDALGYGLMTAVLLDHKAEFDKLWAFGAEFIRYNDGPRSGYFHGRCDVSGDPCDANAGSYGPFYAITALLFAEGRWGNGQGVLNYGQAADEALDTMQNKEQQNGGIVNGVVSLFNSESFLPQRTPTVEALGETALEDVSPALFEFWGARSGNPFWAQAASSSRELLGKAPHPVSGLAPRFTDDQGNVLQGGETFDENTYGFLMNIALDNAWYGPSQDHIDLANRITRFFAGYGDQMPPGEYDYSGEQSGMNTSGALVALIGSVASASTVPARRSFIQRVWETPMPVGRVRYFDGVNQMLSLLFLSGRFHVY